MNRRNALKAAVAGVSAAVPGHEVEVKEGSDPLLIVIRSDRCLTRAASESIRDSMTKAVRGTVLENIAVVVCDHGMTVDVLLREGKPVVVATEAAQAVDCNVTFRRESRNASST